AVGPGASYLAVCRAARETDGVAAATLDGIAAVLAGERSRFTLEYPCHSPEHQRWFELVATPLGDRLSGVVISHTDITARRRAAATLQERNQLLAALHDTTVALLNEVGSPRLVDTIINHAVRLTNAE